MGLPSEVPRACRCSLFIGFFLVLTAVPACRMTDVPVWATRAPQEERVFEVDCLQGVPYSGGADADAGRHRLDVFLPRGRTGYPVLLLVHGGAWMVGDNRCCGLYSAVGEFFASQGVGCVVVNYRLSPWVQHPEHIKDVARAFAWTHAHIAEFGGRPDRVFLLGHSAGGHLVSLLATDESYLRAEGLGSEDIRGVIAVSGVYHIPAGSLGVTLGGEGPVAFRLEQLLPLRGVSEQDRSGLPALPGLPVSVNIYGPAFGNDSEVRADASPLAHVRPGLPPFLLLSAEKDLPTLAGMAEEFHAALRAQGGEARLLRINGRNHNSILFCATHRDDPTARAVLAFLRADFPPDTGGR
jgi:acetyl esterase/lipase